MSDNDYIKLRIHDLNDIRQRLIKNILGENQNKIDEVKNTHVVAIRELTPILAAILSKKKVQGVVAEEGAGYFSHASIILRSLGIPILSGINFNELGKYKGQYAIVDCNKEKVVVNPNYVEVIKYKLSGVSKGNNVSPDGTIKYPRVTADGHSISLRANISNIKEFSAAKISDIDGIGLVRTESLFINYKRIPDEKRQFLIYSKIARDMGEKPVVIRTADIGGDKLPDSLGINPESLKRSSRGIKRSLQQRDEFMVQIRSILKASEFGSVSITFPMVFSAQDIMDIKVIIANVSKELNADGYHACNSIKIGALIETIAAIDDLENILKEVDFISIGTNDLLHQFCGLSRKCSTIEKRSYFEPEFLKKLEYCIRMASVYKKSVSICGEMASDPAATVILVGMGVKDLSMSPAYLAGISRVISKISLVEAAGLAKKAMGKESIEEVKQMLSLWIQNRM